MFDPRPATIDSKGFAGFGASPIFETVGRLLGGPQKAKGSHAKIYRFSSSFPARQGERLVGSQLVRGSQRVGVGVRESGRDIVPYRWQSVFR